MIALDREEFLNDSSVIAFTQFIHDASSRLPVDLKIKKSAKVPGGVDASARGFQEVLKLYKWQSKCIDRSGKQLSSQSWAETRFLLGRLKEDLLNAVQEENEDLVKYACLNILKWGGDRNSHVGAAQDIEYLYGKNKLSEYLRQSQSIFAKRFITDDDIRAIPYTGSMWTKIYALNSHDGLPIYDSRVAMAIIGLLLLFERETDQNTSNNEFLTFRVPIGTNWERNKSFGIDLSKASKISKNDPLWTIDTLKLSWLADLLLSQSKLFSDEGSLNARKHAFEATLFMIGYDLKCIIR